MTYCNCEKPCAGKKDTTTSSYESWMKQCNAASCLTAVIRQKMRGINLYFQIKYVLAVSQPTFIYTACLSDH